MKKIFIGVYNKSVILTYIGLIIAIVGISLSFNKNTLARNSMFNYICYM